VRTIKSFNTSRREPRKIKSFKLGPTHALSVSVHEYSITFWVESNRSKESLVTKHIKEPESARLDVRVFGGEQMIRLNLCRNTRHIWARWRRGWQHLGLVWKVHPTLERLSSLSKVATTKVLMQINHRA
jgi:hypothetical protein